MTRRSGDSGFVTLQYVIAVAWSLVLLVLVANFLVDLYARGAVGDALDDGVRAAAPSSQPVAACETRAQEVVTGRRGPLVTARVHCQATALRHLGGAGIAGRGCRCWCPTGG